MTDKAEKGITLIELLVAIAIVGILAVLVAPEIGRFRSNYNARSCATDLIQHMRAARAMAIKENREYLIVFQLAGDPSAAINPQGRYLIGFDGDGDNNLTTQLFDTFGICNDTDNNRLPNNDADANGDNVPDCVRVINLNECGNGISFGTLAAVDPDGDVIACNGQTVCFGATANPVRADFNPNGSIGNLGSAYFQQTTRGYSYVVIASDTSGSMNMWKWDGDADNALNPNWTEIR